MAEQPIPSPATAADLSIVIVNWNGGHLLMDGLASIEANCTGHLVETVVVDNDSKDDSVGQVRRRFPGVRLIASGGNLGFARACNVGVRSSSGKVVMFLNPDASLTPGTLPAISEFLSTHPGVGAVGCRILAADGTTEPLMFQEWPTPWREFVKLFLGHNVIASSLGLSLKTVPADRTREAAKLSGACLVVRREVLESLGGFDERFFMYCEDGELCQRIQASGWKLYYLAEAVIHHRQGSCSRKAPKGFSTLMQCDSFAKYMEKYHGASGCLRYRILMLLGSSVRVVAAVLGYLLLGLWSPARRKVWDRRLTKNWFIFQWSCGLGSPTIPD